MHSQIAERYRCTTCGQTFAAITGNPYYCLRTAADLVTVVLTLVCNGCPLQAIVAAFGLDERTVAAWVTCAGRHCQQVHQHLVQQGQMGLQHVQADELWVKLVGLRVWMAMAMVVQRQSETGLEELCQGMAAVLATGNTLSRPFCLVLLAEAAGHVGLVDEGLRLLAETRMAVAESGRSELLAEVYRLQGVLLLRQVIPDAAQAEACFQQALAIARRQETKS